MTDSARLYEFAFRGLLSEQALDSAGRTHTNIASAPVQELAQLVSLDSIDELLVDAARAMSVVYTAIAAFENSARKLISSILLDQVGADWWDKCVSHQIRRRAETRKEDEERVKWHGKRGGSLMEYTDMGDLANIIRGNWQHFEPHIPSVEWAASVLSVVERSRNVIMHSGDLSREDVARVGINIRDWAKQVGV